MPRPIMFPEATVVLGRPLGMSADACGDLPVFRDGERTVSLWALSWGERFAVLFRGRIWLGVIAGWSQPPVYLDTGKTVFGTLDEPGKS